MQVSGSKRKTLSNPVISVLFADFTRQRIFVITLISVTIRLNTEYNN